MKPAVFDYHRPATVSEVHDLLSEFGDDAKLLAGGQSLVALMNMRLSTPAHIIDLGDVTDLAGVDVSGDQVRIAAMTTYADAEDDPLVADAVPLLADAIPRVAHRTIRNRGTIGGSVAHADPAAEVPAVAMALDAIVEITSSAGRRTVEAADFFEGPYITALADDELIESVVWPRCGVAHRCAMFDITRRPGDYALAGLASAVELRGGRLHDLRLVSYAIGPTPFRLTAAEQVLNGAPPDDVTEADLNEATSHDVRSVRPEDLYSDEAAQTLTRAALSWLRDEVRQ